MFQNLGFYLVLGGETQTISVVNCSYHICIFSKLLHKIVRLVGPMHSNFTVWLLFMHAHFDIGQEDLLIISLTPLQNLSVNSSQQLLFLVVVRKECFLFLMGSP